MKSYMSVFEKIGKQYCNHASFQALIISAVIIWASFLPCVSLTAATLTWTGAANTNWNDAANWGGTVPGDGDAVVVPDVATRPSMPGGATYPAAGSFLSFEVQSGAIVYCLGDTNVINEASGGTADKKHGAGVTINCWSALINGTLSANWVGFPGAANGYRGPNQALWGGSYGGMTIRAAVPTSRYGSLTQPTALGSGDYNIMPGGGAVKIAVSDTFTVNGSITANGRGNASAAGSGGSVWLICNQFAGTGTVSALGGSSPRVGENASGGGGRISIECQNNEFQGEIKVGGGCGPGPGYGISRLGGQAQAGTLWFPKWFAGREGTRADPTDLNLDGPEFGVRYWFDDSSVTQYWNVYMTNSWLEVYGGSAAIANLWMTNSCFWINETAMSNFNIYGSIYLLNANVYLPPYGVYDMAGDFTMADTNTILYASGDTNAVNPESGGVETNKHGIGLNISCRNAFIAGRIDGFGKGFLGPPPAGGPGCLGASLGGGGHGGHGGGSYSSWRRIYGSLMRPTALGSSGYHISRGGGAVKLRANDTLTLDGTINCNGTWSSSGGSGGSIWLQAGTFTGNGLVSADGPNTIYADTRYGGGGGGRIAIEYGTWDFTGAYSVKGGTNNPDFTMSGRTGTVFLCKSPWLGTTTTNGVNGVQLDTWFSVSSNNVQIAREITRFATSLRWSDLSTDTSGLGTVANEAVYTIRGLRPDLEYSVYVDDIPKFPDGLSTDNEGVLVFTNTLDMLRNFFVTPKARGTIIKLH